MKFFDIHFLYYFIQLQFLSVQQQQLQTSSLMASLSSARCGAVRCGIVFVGCLLHFIGFYAFYFMLMFLLLNFPEFSFTFFCVALRYALCLSRHSAACPAPSHSALAQFTLTLPYATHSACLPFPPPLLDFALLFPVRH